MSAADDRQITLALVSHTNVGKTTLARTLLLRDVGEVRDAAHVTSDSERFELAASGDGDRLVLWDTPGFGDSHRLARRLAQAGNPIGWFLGQVWDRWRDRPLWSSQQAIRTVRDEADVVLYLLNAAEAPADAAYVDPELAILDWTGRPVVALLNQIGAPLPADEERVELHRWRTRLGAAACVHEVLAFDAFARCWVQEDTLLRRIAPLLPAQKRPAFERLARARRQRHEAVFDSSIDVLAQRLARAARDREPLPPGGIAGRLRSVGAAIGAAIGRGDRADGPAQAAMHALAARLDADIRQGTDRLIALHGLDGRAGPEVLTRLAEHYTVHRRMDETGAAILGGLVSGSLAGLKADLATGGLTMGGGLLAGGLLGALGAAGLARGINTVRGDGGDAVAWSDRVLEDLRVSALLGYLAVAHYGRGRGAWTASEHPPHWEQLVREVLSGEAGGRLREAFARRDRPATEQLLGEAIAPPLRDAARAVLARLYPDETTAQAAPFSRSAHAR